MMFKLSGKVNQLFPGQARATELIQPSQDADTHRCAIAKPPRYRDVPRDPQSESKRFCLSHAKKETRGFPSDFREFGMTSVKLDTRSNDPFKPDMCMQIHRQAQRIESGTEIRRGAGNFDVCAALHLDAPA